MCFASCRSWTNFSKLALRAIAGGEKDRCSCAIKLKQAGIGSRNTRGREFATIQESLARAVFLAVITFLDPAAKC
jgi:hypothetical protein